MQQILSASWLRCKHCCACELSIFTSCSASHMTKRPTIRTGDALRVVRSSQNAVLRVLCLPFAGGSSSIFEPWCDAIPEAIELCALVLPGREGRRREPMLADARTLAMQVVRDLQRRASLPLVLFGHSMGALLANELARALVESGLPEPLLLVVSASATPDRSCASNLSTADDERLVAVADQRWGGWPDELRSHSPLRASVLALIRADLSLLATCTRSCAPRLSCPIHALAGSDDSWVRTQDQLEWQLYTTGPFSLHHFCGGHLFLVDDPLTVARYVVNAATQQLRRNLTKSSRAHETQQPSEEHR